MIGMFAVSEILRSVSRSTSRGTWRRRRSATSSGHVGPHEEDIPLPLLRGSVLGTAIGALPGAGADIAAWMSYAMSKKFSKEREKFGTGTSRESSRPAHRTTARSPARGSRRSVFGIPGDSITAIVIGVLYIKGLNPGPTIFMNNAVSLYAIFIVFILANLLMLPLGIAAIKSAKQMLRAPRELLLPVILLFCIVGSFAINNTVFGVLLMLALRRASAT
jgi:TctA family transporter